VRSVRRRPLILLACAALALQVVAVVAASPAHGAVFTEGVHVTADLKACRNDGTVVLPISGQFICPDLDGDGHPFYVNGNLGKSWNELDLVPHRLQTDLGTQDAATTDYNMYAAADYQAGATPRPGYDVISDLQVNGALSNSSSCTITTGPPTITSGGGTLLVLSRLLTIHQAKGSKCVFDYYQRLALGSHLFPGASLQSYAFSKADRSGANGTISLPVNQIAPQSINKDMTATASADYAWDVTKSPTPASVSFANTCDPAASHQAGVSVTVSWDRLDATQGAATIITHVYATNPSARVITINVTDNIYEGAGPGGTLIDTASTAVAGVDIPANTSSFQVLEHITTGAAGVSAFNDIATATYTDKVTGIPIPGTTTASASDNVDVTSTTNGSATITDVESITGAGLSYSANSFSGASGSFDGGYVPGTPTTGSVSWTSDTQNGDGSVTFSKTVYVDAGTATSGTLHDVASLIGSNGFPDSYPLDIGITSSATTSLTIDKTIPDVLTGNESQTFQFTVRNSANVVVATPSITFNAGDTHKTVDVTGLAPASYTVSETDALHWLHQNPVTVDLTLPTCSGTAYFTNGFGPTTAQAQKVTVPAGSEGGWAFTLNGPGAPAGGETVNSNATGLATFTTALQEGSYTITEASKPGWDQTGSSGCSFTVNFPVDAGTTFTCTITNTARGSITIRKLTIPSGATDKFTFTGDVAGSLGDTETATASVVPGTYHSTETVPTGWDLTGLTCTDSDSSGNTTTHVATFIVAAGENVTCTFTNTQRGKAKVNKTVNGAPPSGTQSFEFQLRQGASISSDGTILETQFANANNGGVLNFTTQLVAGQHYQLCERSFVGWLTSLGPNAFVPNSFNNPNVDNSILCTDFVAVAGHTTTFDVNNTPPPGGRALTIGFWKNWASCAGSKGKQAPILDQTLALADPLVVSALGGSYNTFTGVILALHAGDCANAVSLLNKTPIGGKKASSDPAFNLAAQLIAAELNYAAGAGQSGAVTLAITQAVLLLGKYNFNGSTHTSISKADATTMNSLAKTLDNYNNNI
jgi:hypothetical protein